MAQRSMFFDSIEHDRIYSAVDFAKVFGVITGHDGVAHGYNNGLVVNASSGMSVTVGTGAAFIQGRLFEVFDQAETLTISPADMSNPRIDRVVVRLDLSFNGRTAQLAVKPGTPAAEPLPPALQRDETIWELSLAQIQVGAGVTSITAGNIIDERSDTDACGYVDKPVTPESIGAETPSGAQAKVDAHAGNKSNPHGVTTSQIGAAPASHQHSKSEITDFPSTMTPTAHQHETADIANFSDAISNLPTGATVDGNTIWHAGNVGANSGLNADMVDGSHANAAIIANTIPVRDANGKIPGDITGKASDADTVGGKYPSELGGVQWVDVGDTILLESLDEITRIKDYERVMAFQLINPGRYRVTGELHGEGKTNKTYLVVGPHYVSTPTHLETSHGYAVFSTTSSSYVSFSLDLPVLPLGHSIALYCGAPAAMPATGALRNVRIRCVPGSEPSPTVL